jgi:seryl-tRNA synthetase
MPSRKGYGETHSCSTFHEFQARRLNLKYKGKDGQRQFAYTLNNTALATPRVILALLENYQEEDGTISLPEVLHPYMGGKTRIRL